LGKPCRLEKPPQHRQSSDFRPDKAGGANPALRFPAPSLGCGKLYFIALLTARDAAKKPQAATTR
jgi:hypothetical protein